MSEILEYYSLSQIVVILVETETPGNLGASARAMKSMGLTSLRLVNPSRRESRDAYVRAVYAQDVLQHADHFATLNEAIADCAIVIGTTGKIERLDQPRYTPKELVSFLHTYHSTAKIALVFGRESQGLTVEELSLCHAHVRIPTNPACPSLNLGSAVQVLCYELFVGLLIEPSTSPSTSQVELASHEQLTYLLTQLETLAVKVGALNSSKPGQMMRKMRELFGRSTPRKAELNLLINVFKRLLKKLA
jgi:tRNA (cytidine32/uridine32-2'-O)-methyltransferase